MIYQLLYNNLNVDSSELLTINSLSITSGQNYKLLNHNYLQESFFTVRAINDWNNLPYHVIKAPSLNDFKNYLTVAGLLFCMITY